MTDFPSYDSLPLFPENTDYIELIKEISSNATSHSVKPHIQLETLTKMRQLRKSNKELFNKCFNNIISRFLLIYTDTTITTHQVVLHTLCLIKELLSEFAFEYEDKWIKKMFNALLANIYSSHNEIQLTVKDAFINMSCNMHFTITLFMYFKAYYEQDDECKTYMFNLIAVFIENIEVMHLVYGIGWNELFMKINGCICDDMFYLKEVFMLMRKKMGNKWEEFMFNISEEYASQIKQMVG